MKIKNNEIEAIRKYNTVQVLNTLRQTGQRLSRPIVADMLGLSKVTISNILRDLSGLGLTTEAGVGVPDSRGGRKPQLVTLDHDNKRVIGARADHDLIELILSDITGREVRRLRATVHGRSRETLIKEMTEEVLLDTGTRRDAVLGLVAVIEDEDGLVRKCHYHGCPEDNTPQKYGGPDENPPQSPLRNELSRALRLPVWLIDPTRARAFAECWFNHSQSRPANFFYLNLGYTLDGVATRHSLLDNSFCEIGSCYMSARPYGRREETLRTANMVLSGETILDKAAQTFGRPLTIDGLKRMADEGEDGARRIFQEFGYDLGCTISLVVHMTALKNVIVGGLLSPAWSHFKESMQEGLELHLPGEVKMKEVTVSPLRHDLGSGLMGALAMAMDRWVYHTEILYTHSSQFGRV